MDQNYFRCSECKKIIHEGETMWSVNIHNEVERDGAISVLSADCVFLFCEECSKQRDFFNIIVPTINSVIH